MSQKTTLVQAGHLALAALSVVGLMFLPVLVFAVMCFFDLSSYANKDERITAQWAQVSWMVFLWMYFAKMLQGLDFSGQRYR